MERRKVLIADGSSFIRITLGSVLETLGFEVVATAKEGQECVDRCLEIKPQIVLLDLAIADVGNFAAVRAIVQDNPLSAIILMVPEQLDIPEVIVDAVRAGVSGYIKKPLSPEDIKRRIEGTLRR